MLLDLLLVFLCENICGFQKKGDRIKRIGEIQKKRGIGLKIKLVVADSDSNYIRHLSSCVQINYFDRLELSTFSAQENLDDFLQKQECDVLLTTSDFVVSEYRGIRFVLTTEKGVEEVDGIRALCKYQKMEKLYKQILRDNDKVRYDIQINSIQLFEKK